LRDLSQQKNPRELCRGSFSNFTRSHVPMEIFPFYNMRKKVGNKKRVVVYYLRREVPVLMRSSEVWEHASTHALSRASLPHENALV
jgi:hypothetical protein